MSADPSRAAVRSGYPWAMRALHWATAVLLVGSYTTMWATESAASDAAVRSLTAVHRSLGLVVLGLTTARLILRQRSIVPALPADIPRPQRFAAGMTVVALYASLFLQPLLGLTASMYHGDRITLVGGVVVPGLLAPDRHLARQLFQAHGVVGTLLLGLLGLHVAAALHHHVIRRDEVLAGMLPGVRPLPRPRPAQRSAART